MNYEVSGRAVGDSGPTAPYTAPRPTKSRRSRVARPRGGSLSSPAQGRLSTDRRHGPEETPHPDWRLSCGIRGHRTRGEDPRNIHPRTRLSLIRTRGSSSASRKRLPHRLPRQGCSETFFPPGDRSTTHRNRWSGESTTTVDDDECHPISIPVELHRRRVKIFASSRTLTMIRGH